MPPFQAKTPPAAIGGETFALESGESRESRGVLRLGLFVTIVALTVGAVIMASRAQPAPIPFAFDQRTVKQIARHKPQVVLLGNSMVQSRFHEPTLNRLIAPRRASVLGIPGTKTAVWYLMLKNQVFPAVRPERVLIFFYDDELTSPRARALGSEQWKVERVSIGEEPVVSRKLAPPWNEPVRRLAWHAGRLAPVERLHLLASEPLDRWAVQVSAWLQSEPDVAARKTAINDLFALDSLRGETEPAERPNDVDPIRDNEDAFTDGVDGSFLPDIIELARKSNVKLTFVHIRQRESAMGQPLPANYRKYLDDLKKYLQPRGVKFVDMTSEQWEQLSLYGQNSHIKLHQRRKYTKLFVQNMAETLK